MSNAQPFPSVLVSYFGELEYYYEAFHALNIPVDVISADYDLSKYKVVVAPLMHMVKTGFKETIEGFVRQGGTFIATYFTGVIDENVGVFLGGYLGPLKDVLGVKVEEYCPLPIGGKNRISFPQAVDGFQNVYQSSIWGEVEHTTTAKPLAYFDDNYYAGSPCFTENRYGQGRAYYIATRLNEDFMRDLIHHLATIHHIEVPVLPAEVELVTRSRETKKFHFYLNHADGERKVKLPQGKYRDLLSGAVCQDTLKLERYGVSILTDV
jgi:beta-galactosidase